jgi:hypothetical protein
LVCARLGVLAQEALVAAFWESFTKQGDMMAPVVTIILKSINLCNGRTMLGNLEQAGFTAKAWKLATQPAHERKRFK